MRAWRAVSDRGIWGALDILSDIFTVCFAMCDILMDTWIAYTYYTEGRTGFFYISVALLMLAQICYASLFICTFAETKSGWTQLWIFLCVLPFGQLVPLLVYVESLHLEWFEEWILWFGFDTTSSPVIQPGEDFMLYRIRCKVMSHIGFLVEACVEAVPQSVLQLVAMQHAGEANLFSVLSIVLSISCLASKGYVAAFSVHFKTFVFNGICIAVDILGIFATAAWLSTPKALPSFAGYMCTW